MRDATPRGQRSSMLAIAARGRSTRGTSERERPGSVMSASAAGSADGPGGGPREHGLATRPRPALAEGLALLAVMAVALWLRLHDIDQPYSGLGWQHMSARVAILARNYAENGWAATHLAPASDAVPPADGLWRTYVNHPPLVPLVISLSYRAFGVHEWSGRIVMVGASLAALLALWALTRSLFGPHAALVTAALGATAPVTAFYGPLISLNGSLLLLFVSLALLQELRQAGHPTRTGFAWQLLWLLLAAATDWEGHLLIALLAAHQLWLGRPARAAALAGLLIVTAALHAALVLGAASVSLKVGAPDTGRFASVFWARSWGGLAPLGGVERVVKALGRSLFHMYLPPTLLLAATGLLRLRAASRPSLPVLMLLFGVADCMIFVEGAARHEFWITILAPALLVLAGGGAAAMVAGLRTPALRAAACGLLAVGMAAPGALTTRARFAEVADDYDHTLGTVIAAHTRHGDVVGTCEAGTDALAYYARRTLGCGLTDARLPADGILPSPDAAAVFVLPETKRSFHDHERLLALLAEQFESEVVITEACGPVHVFDLGRRRR